jgi:hypothetical protein
MDATLLFLVLVVEEAVRPQLYGQVLRQRKPDFQPYRYC